MTILEALQFANEELKTREGDDTPMLDAELLLAMAMNVPKSWLFTHFNEIVSKEAEGRFDLLLKRRMAHEPVAYLLGSKDFYGRTFEVNRHVLIPRPATETLVEEALLVARETEPDALLFADIGTGSGAIAITLAAESGIPAIATDLSDEALRLASANARTHGVADQVEFRQGDLLAPLLAIFEALRRESPGMPIRRLVLAANLPYLTDEQVETAQPDVRLYEPHLALAAGPDGLDAYWHLLRELKKYRPVFPQRITALLEIDPSQRDQMLALIRHDWPEADIRVAKDLQGNDRVVVAEL